jgi:hypothetical protein
MSGFPEGAVAWVAYQEVGVPVPGLVGCYWRNDGDGVWAKVPRRRWRRGFREVGRVPIERSSVRPETSDKAA